MVFEGEPCQPRSYVSEGFLLANGVKEDNLISVPATSVGDILLYMVVSDDFTVRTIRASSISIASEGNFKLEASWDAEGNRTATK
jgi:hypothetical protein